MRKKLPKHLSYDYQLKLDEMPTKHADRMPLKVVMPAIILGLLMLILGCFELSNGMYTTQGWTYTLDESTRPPLFDHRTVDTAFIILGLGIIISAIVCHIRYKKIFFNGKTFSVDLKGVFGENELFKEFLRNYDGVRLRMEFFQFGILNKNKYIVELVHRDPAKSIPLYISTDGTGIYQIWDYYAKRLNMPTIIDTDEGTVVKEVSELDKSLKEYLFARGMLNLFEKAPKAPKAITCIQKTDRTIIKPKKMFWDILNLLAGFWLFFYLLVLAGAIFNYEKVERMIGSPLQTAVFFIVTVGLAIFFLALMFKKDKIVIKDNKLILVHKFLLFSAKEYINLEKIRDIQVVFNPASNRYYLAIITDDNMLAFGKSTPIEGLQWARDFIIYMMVKQK